MTVELPPHSIWLDSFDLGGAEQEWGSAQAGRSVDGRVLTIGNRTFERGLGMHAEGIIEIDLKGAARELRAFVGVDQETETNGSVDFVVYVDGVERFRSGVLRPGDAPRPLVVDLSGASELALVSENGGDDINWDHADWCAALLVLDPAAKQIPETLRPPAEAPPQLAPFEINGPPRIHPPRITGATAGRPFLFRIPAAGTPPLRFSAAGLPAGLTLDPLTGILSGALASDGTSTVAITVENAAGRATATLTIVAGPDKLALTPPMGWNSWNVWGTAVDDAKVRAAADGLVQSGLAAHGYQYINIDDAWEGARDAAGRIQTNEKFPDMKALADYVHSKGLKLGIYSSPGPKTCAQFEGSYEHELLDAQQYADWGIDLLKHDWCSYGTLVSNPDVAAYQKPYRVMRDALDQAPRDIVYSLCQYGMGRVSEWGAAVGGNYWRTTGDITDTWASMSAIGFGQAGLEPFAGPGGWNDPDMLVVGMVGWGPSLHPTRLTPNEQVTHMTLWSLLAAPLLIGCDLTQLDPFTLALLTNPEVLEVNQDPLGKQARRISIGPGYDRASAADKSAARPRRKSDGGVEIWARPLADGTHAVGLFNRSRGPATVSVAWSDLGLTAPQPVRDLWRRVDLGELPGGFSTTVPRHGAVMIRVGRAKARSD